MIVPKSRSKYTNKKKLVIGRGFVDTMSSIFNSIRPTLKNVGSFIKENKDLIAKPILGAVGQIAATGISKGIPTLLSTIMNRKKQQQQQQLPAPALTKKSEEILNAILSREAPNEIMPTTNIIGSGYKKSKFGSGLKTF